jgi:protoporphyrinogen oxidase
MIVILGAGLAGLSTAYHLRRGGRRDVALYEREERPGGLARSEHRDGFTFDYTGHFLHLRNADTRRLATRWLGPELPQVVRSSWIFSHGVYTRYPFQTNTYGLPIPVVKECVLGSIQARYGTVEIPREPADAQGLPEPRRSFERWVYETFGSGIAKHFMIPYNDKLWAVHPRFLTTDWMGRYVPPAPLEQVIEGALTDQTASVGYNATFHYPRRGGIETFARALAQRAGPIHANCEAIEMDTRRRRVRFADGSVAEYESLVSTLPLPELCQRLRPLPKRVGDAAAKLRFSSVFAINLGVRGDGTEGRHWVYVPERRYVCYRLGCFSNAARSMAPPSHSSLWVEIGYNAHRPLHRREMRRQALDALRATGFLRSRRDVVAEWLLDIPCAYVTYDAHYRQAVRTIHRYLEAQHIHSIGRYGRWEYSSMEDALLEGRATAQRLLGAEAGSEIQKVPGTL